MTGFVVEGYTYIEIGVSLFLNSRCFILKSKQVKVVKLRNVTVKTSGSVPSSADPVLHMTGLLNHHTTLDLAI